MDCSHVFFSQQSIMVRVNRKITEVGIMMDCSHVFFPQQRYNGQSFFFTMNGQS
jgi:hypothetical protein